ncbi:MAG: hypothetical protein COW00_11245 [Bdellovibrio sp. CG12_big_fil_rev_8_21_14_0_65_39_13]|nr:MAG: hypothetical protein COW78_16600 [Bdellovibrio sp. CG22_combo_CG10-13_8_21_14_all_39_27]PIQ59296.1 MAG: hypothetical protein COW00_11245 [Bdellovibrio sp. CG12_big_fil_rev_8_21_14_0_65_39_13]PIR32307.1 MAG: hypothetical protein COV37_20535 [Bdellovibrio sp. CG11_big_fil_rev_8_21_14_0_20_39_38]PJB52547.1 MAG: hypothetical protein CO099_12050 [Bdellovibrio sp. CG_4_9_14_3_um_filter_39_7]
MSATGRLFAIVMAGGKGTRFWPESTSAKPKQYLSLVSPHSLLEETLTRFDGLVPVNRRYVVTVREQEALAKKSSEGNIEPHHFIFEPSGRNTAPCILLSMAQLEMEGATDEDILAIVPSDHVILNKDGFQHSVKVATETASQKGGIVTIGIKPHFPHTGYGYIHQEKQEGPELFKVASFKEKPNFETAKEYVSTGEYFWNAGMFVARLDVLKKEFQTHSPKMWSSYEDLKKNCHKAESLRNVYEQIPSDSIDYAIMEKSEFVYVVPAAFDWNDLGSWDALESVIAPTDSNIVVKDNGHSFIDAKNNIVYAPGKHVALVGVNDLIVVSNDKAVIVLPKEQAQRIKEVVELLKKTPEGQKLL